MSNNQKIPFEETYISAKGWMVSILNLKGNELLAFALIYGFSQDGESEYRGSISYMQTWLNCTRPTAISVTKSLVKKKLAIKRQGVLDGQKRNFYTPDWLTINRLKSEFYASKISLLATAEGSKEILPLGSKEILPNIISNKAIVDKYNIYLQSLPTDEEFKAHGESYLRRKLKAKYDNLKGPEYWLDWELGKFKAYWEELKWKHPKGKRKGEYIDALRSFTTWMGNWLESWKVTNYCITDPRHPNNLQTGTDGGSAGVYDRSVDDALGKGQEGGAGGRKLANSFKA